MLEGKLARLSLAFMLTVDVASAMDAQRGRGVRGFPKKGQSPYFPLLEVIC